MPDVTDFFGPWSGGALDERSEQHVAMVVTSRPMTELAPDAVMTPDFASHGWDPLVRVSHEPPFAVVTWADGQSLSCFSLWLFENSIAIDPVTRESTVDPGDLPGDDVLVDASLARDGRLLLTWADGRTSEVHPGWLRSIADGRHLPNAGVGEPVVWSVSEWSEPPSFDGTDVVTDDAVLKAWLESLCTYGLGRLRHTPVDRSFLRELATRIGPIRGSNFGDVFTVEAVLDADSTANTGLNLGQHADLPTRETPPGFQFLHCVENSVAGGASRMTDGLAVVAELAANHPVEYEALCTLRWTFANRAKDGDHRWIGPIIDHGSLGSPLTMRAFYPVRLAPHMDTADVPRGYAAMRVFSQVAHDPRFMMRSRFEPGDLVGFDNRRVLHGRDEFDAGTGTRVLVGCYIDRDDVMSRLRVLHRAADASTEHPSADHAVAPATR